MALTKKKVVKKKVVKKAPAKKTPVKKKIVKKKAPAKKPVAKVKLKKKAGAAKKAGVKPGSAKAGKGKYAYEPYRAKKNVGNCAKNACLQGKGTDDVIDIVKAEFPDCNISTASVGYYRSALRREGYDL